MTIKDILAHVHDRPATRKRFDIALGLPAPFGGYDHPRLREALLAARPGRCLAAPPSRCRSRTNLLGAASEACRAQDEIETETDETVMTDFFATHFAFITTPEGSAAMVTLIAMEVVLGIDNLIFISILTNKLPESTASAPARSASAWRWSCG